MQGTVPQAYSQLNSSALVMLYAYLYCVHVLVGGAISIRDPFFFFFFFFFLRFTTS